MADFAAPDSSFNPECCFETAMELTSDDKRNRYIALLTDYKKYNTFTEVQQLVRLVADPKNAIRETVQSRCKLPNFGRDCFLIQLEDMEMGITFSFI